MKRLTLQEAIEERARLTQECRAILDKAQKENHATLPAEERAGYDTRDKRIDELDEFIELETKQQKRDAMLEQRAGAAAGRPDPNAGAPGQGEGETRAEISEEVRSLFGAGAGEGRFATPEYRATFNAWLSAGQRDLPSSPEMRTLQADVATAGGYLQAPQQFIAELIKNVDDAVFIRQKARKVRVISADSLGQPRLDTDVSDAEWTSELTLAAEDTGVKFGNRELRPHELTKFTKVSNKLIRKAVISIEQFVRERLAYKFAVSQEKAFLTGNGTGQPLGAYTPSADGISTARDITVGTATNWNNSEIGAADGLLDMKYALKAAYWPNAEWTIHRDGMKRLRKIKDTTNQYIFQPGLKAGEPSLLFDIPIQVSEFSPNTFTATNYVIILGDWSTYWIADALDLQIQRLDELFAKSNETAFIGRAEVDGAPAQEEAFVRGILG